MTQTLHSPLAAAALSAAILLAPGLSQAYGEAAPMSVIGIEALAPVTSLNATTTETAPLESPAPVIEPVSTLVRWMAALRQRLEGAVEVALH